MGKSPESLSEFDQFTSFTERTITNFDPKRALNDYKKLKLSVENTTFLWVAAYTTLIRLEIVKSPMQEEFRKEIDILTDKLVEG